MVGLVIVSHVEKLAQGVVELASLMANEVPMAAAGGLEDGSAGTSFDKIMTAAQQVCGEDGALILMDMGSAVMTAEMVQETLGNPKLRLVDCPLVEGAVAASMASLTGSDLDEVEQAARESRDYRKRPDEP